LEIVIKGRERQQSGEGRRNDLQFIDNLKAIADMNVGARASIDKNGRKV